MDTDKVTRVEVINHANGGGRDYVYWPEDRKIEVDVALQDEGRTLKVFIKSLE